MSKNMHEIAERLGATVVCQVPEVGGGVFGMTRLAGIISALRTRLQPGQGVRPGRPTDPDSATTGYHEQLGSARTA